MNTGWGERGTGLYEVMIVVVILGIAAAMAVPNYLASTARAQLRQAVTELMGNVYLARMIAMNRNAPVTVNLSRVTCPPATANCGRIQATFTSAGGGTVMASQLMPAAIQEVTGTPVVTFSSIGLRAGGGAALQSLQLTNTYGLTYEIQISSAGQARWCATAPCPPF
jgi:type IV fimbrial biogenesis protein FimT